MTGAQAVMASEARREEYVSLRVKRLTGEHLTRKPNKWLAQMAKARRSNRVLDIACGLGEDSFAWARAGKRVVATDLNFDLLKNSARMAAQHGLKIDFVACEATHLPFKEQVFDISYSENVFEHVPAWREIATEARRVLSTGGLFFVRTTNGHCPFNPEINHFHFYPWFPGAVKRPLLAWIMRNRPAWVNYTSRPAVNWFTHRGLAKSLEQLGFETYEVFDIINPELLGERGRKYALIINLLKRYKSLRYFAYPLQGTVEIYASRPAPVNPDSSRSEYCSRKKAYL